MRKMSILAAAMLAAATGAASAAGTGERVYDDSFGNLVVISPAGYKRIVVGMGHVAAELRAERGADAGYARGDDLRDGQRCYQPAVLWKGRSYMYGLADGEIPTPPVVCD